MTSPIRRPTSSTSGWKPDVEQRDVREAQTQGLDDITVSLAGKIPESPHARCDMLDREALKLAKEEGLEVVGAGVVKKTKAKLSRTYWCSR